MKFNRQYRAWVIQVEALTYMTRRYHNIRIAFEAGYDLVDMVGLEIELKR